MCEGDEGGIREGEGLWRGDFFFFDSCIRREGKMGSIGIELVDSGIYSAPGLRGFGLGGLGRPSMS
jgi:hypothetical protein